MKLLYVSPNAELGGAERILETFIKYHDRQQFEVFVVFLREGSLEEKWRNLGAQVLKIPPFRFRNLSQLLQKQWLLRKILSENKIDLVHSTMSYGHLFAGPVALSLGIPEIWFQHGPVGKSWDQMAALVPTNLILCNSHYTEKLQNRLSSSQTKVIYGPVEIPKIDPLSVNKLRDDFRKKFKFSSDDFLCVHVARLDPWKGQENFIKAIALAHEKNPKIKGLVVGGTDLGHADFEQQLKNYVQEKGLQKVIHFTGHLNSVSEAFYAADMFIHTSKIPEPLGLSILEALACGTPVIAANLGGPIEILTHGENGFLNPASDIENLKNLILTLVEQPMLRSKFKTQGLAKAQEFEAKAWVKKVEQIYTAL